MKMLIPLDGSKFAEDVLEPARRLASRGDESFEMHLVSPVNRCIRTSMCQHWLNRPMGSAAPIWPTW